MDERFPLISLKGSYREIGKKHGEILKNRIESSIEFYKDVTEKLTYEEREVAENDILRLAEYFRTVIEKNEPNQAEEIEAISKSSEIDILWIYALNARTEIMNNRLHGSFSECTAFYFSQTSILGQNWDWAEQFLDLAVIMKITNDDGHQILQLTEPGIIGKIGLNGHGIGVCLNFLESKEKLTGLPIHSTLRSILETKSFDEAMLRINQIKSGKASNILVGSKDGKYQDIEFGGDDTFFLDNTLPVQIHTNHYLGNSQLNTKEDLTSSFYRYNKAITLTNELSEYSVNDGKTILLDKSNENLPICRKFISGSIMKSVGTVCSIVMDLKKKEMHITKGNPISQQFEIIQLKL